ncbi:hypothetical protein QCA50_012265 [Cerrena zonata]|uniref:Superoxide dismutase copper/zinc binding domain-containing protein n=1 Tax=Cerrena zonata TaxID=2478898 RepID=A0AAW0FWY1_9APHY
MVSARQIVQSLTLASVGLSSAPKVADSPQGAKYVAKIDSDKVKGQIEFSTAANGTVQVDVDLKDLPEQGGPFLYHIHEKTVPSDGNCTGTAAHFNPYGGNENNTQPQDKEVGDLSGRHDDAAFFANLSVVVHLNNTTRIGCANITEVSSNSTDSDDVATVSADSGASAYGVHGMVAGAAAAGLALLI